MYEPTDLEWAIASRGMMALPAIGPLTLEQEKGVEAYDRYHEEQEEEYRLQEAAGGRTVCPGCGHRSVRHRLVYTLGYAGHPGAEQSDYEACERDECSYAAV
jgi:ribosomal protein L32